MWRDNHCHFECNNDQNKIKIQINVVARYTMKSIFINSIMITVIWVLSLESEWGEREKEGQSNTNRLTDKCVFVPWEVIYWTHQRKHWGGKSWYVKCNIPQWPHSVWAVVCVSSPQKSGEKKLAKIKDRLICKYDHQWLINNTISDVKVIYCVLIFKSKYFEIWDISLIQLQVFIQKWKNKIISKVGRPDKPIPCLR